MLTFYNKIRKEELSFFYTIHGSLTSKLLIKVYSSLFRSDMTMVCKGMKFHRFPLDEHVCYLKLTSCKSTSNLSSLISQLPKGHKVLLSLSFTVFDVMLKRESPNDVLNQLPPISLRHREDKGFYPCYNHETLPPLGQGRLRTPATTTKHYLPLVKVGCVPLAGITESTTLPTKNIQVQPQVSS